MVQINWTDESRRWLQEIYDFIVTDNPDAAFRVVEGIYERVQMLVSFPKLGHRYLDIPDREIRILLYGHYRIAYLVKPDQNIDILGIFHGALDINTYLT